MSDSILTHSQSASVDSTVPALLDHPAANGTAAMAQTDGHTVRIPAASNQSARENLANLAKTLPALSLHASPDTNRAASMMVGNDTISGATRHSLPEGTWTSMAHSAAYASLQVPLEAAAQLIDHTAGQIVRSDLYDKSKGLLVDAPRPADFGSAEFYGQTIGGAIGAIPWFMLSRGILRNFAGAFSATKWLVLDAAESSAHNSVFSAAGRKLVLEGGLTGGLYAGAFQPVSSADGNYWTAKAKLMTKDFASFSALTASSLVIGGQLGKAVAPLAERSPLAAALAPKALAVMTGSLSGIPAAAVDMGMDKVLSNEKSDASLDAFAKNAFTYALIGGLMGTMPSTGEGGRARATTPEGEFSLSSSSDLIEWTPGKVPFHEPIAGTELRYPAPSNDHFRLAQTAELAAELDHLPNSFEFQQMLDGRSIGKLPDALSGQFKPGSAMTGKLFGYLDSLAMALRSLDTALPPQKKTGLGAEQLDLPPFTLRLAGQDVQVSKVGIGEVAHVYKLSVDGCDFAFKVPNDPERMDVHGLHAETAAFVYLSKEKSSDLIDFHAAHPGSEGGWMLTEFVDHPIARSGAPVADTLAKSGLVLGDDWAANRGPGNVIWDLGGVEPRAVNTPSSVEQLKELLATPEGKRVAGRRLDGISDPKDLKQALMMCLEYPQLGGQVARSAARRLRDPADLADVLSRALEIPGAAGRAAFELDSLAKTPYMPELFYKALGSPEARIEATKHIDKLPPDQRKAAFDAAFAYPEARAMAAKAISSLPTGAEQAEAAARASDYPGSNYIRYQQLAKTRDLTPTEAVERQLALEHYLESYGVPVVRKTGSAAHQLTFENWQRFINVEPPFVSLQLSDDNLSEAELQLLSRLNGNGPEQNSKSVEALEHELQMLQIMWPDLNQSQRTLGPEQMAQLARAWENLRADDWKNLNATEATEQADLTVELKLDHQQAKSLFLHPDLRTALSGSAPELLSKHLKETQKLLNCIDEIPVKYLHLPLDDLLAIGNATATNRFSPEAWAKIPPADAADLSRAATALNLYDDNFDAPEKLTDFAKWYSREKGEPAADWAQLGKIYEMWDQLGPMQKTHTRKQLFSEAKAMEAEFKLGKLLGEKSSEMSYLTGLSPDPSDGTRPIISVSDWLKWADNVQLNQFTQERAKAQIKALVQEQAPGAEFASVALTYRFFMDLNFGDKPELRKKVADLMGGIDNTQKAWSFIRFCEQSNSTLLKIAAEQGRLHTDRDWKRLYEAAQLSPSLELEGDANHRHLLWLHDQGLRFDELTEYLTENPQRYKYIAQKLGERAPKNDIDPRRLVEKEYIERLTNFSEKQKKQLTELFDQGLSIFRLANYVKDDPKHTKTISELLTQGSDARTLNDVMRLSAFPEPVALKLAAAARQGDITVENVLSRAKDLRSGSSFTDLLTASIKNGIPPSQEGLNALAAKASTMAAGKASTAVGQTLDQNSFSETTKKMASSFSLAANSILNQVPADTPVVLLGRDAWPLVPILRAHGRENVHYFLWSRLQNHDSSTHHQWLKEIPPGAAVIDTGYVGSIIDRIKDIDPSVSGGYLMSTSMNNYPRLLPDIDHGSRVQQIEALPKLINRSSTHSSKGGAVARRSTGNNDVDYDAVRTLEKRSRWNIERRSSDILRAAGLPHWYVWRYSQFVGLTPLERLGLSSKAEVEAHFQAVEKMRKSNSAQPET